MVVDDRPHADEHSLEVHLPFLQVALGDGWSVVPIVVGQVPVGDGRRPARAAVGRPRDARGRQHRPQPLPRPATPPRRLDAATAAAVVARRWRDVEPDRACGAFPLRGLLAEAERRGLPVELLDLRTSGDTAGDQRRVVGYGAFAVG